MTLTLYLHHTVVISILTRSPFHWLILSPFICQSTQCYPGGTTNLMLAAQANLQTVAHPSPSSPSSKFLANIGAKSSTTQCSRDRSTSSASVSPNLVSACLGNHLSPTSVSSSVSSFIYPALTGRCHLMSEKIVDVESSVLAYSQVRLYTGPLYPPAWFGD